MPLPKRTIEPIHVARSVFVREELPSELETVTNTTLTNIVRQLSSLSKHSEDLFGELARDASNLAERANSLQARIDRLAVKVTQLDSTVEEVSLQDIQLKKQFKSANTFDQQIFSRATMPTAMLETYQMCDKPPPLDKLNCYRDDGKDGLKFYTDPNYFFELWRQEMLKDTDRIVNKKHKQPRTADTSVAGSGGGHKKRVRQPHNTREKQRQIAIGHGETLMPNNVIYRTPNQIMNAHDEIYNSMGVYDPTRPPRPNSIEIRRSYPAESVDGSSGGYLHPQQQSPSYNQTSSNYSQQMYDEYSAQQQQMYGQGQGPLSSESLYAPGTPTRGNGGGYGTGKSRPSAPPPAPPSTGSNGGTPNASNANTPTRGRSMSTGRDALPPPPPIPEGLQSPPLNGTSGVLVNKILGRSSSTSRSGSPQLGQNILQQDPNALVMAQLNSQINNLNNINHQMNQMNNINDLPPPPPIPDQHHLQQQHHMSPKMMGHHAVHHAAPPPPPPPPLPMDISSNGGSGPQSPPHSIMSQLQQMQMGNGDLQPNGILGGKVLNKVPPKKVLTPYEDTRTDLMKAIRDGIKLRKVEKDKIDAKDAKNNSALHDVASILARRVAIELSESEDSESDDDSEGWMEPSMNETSA